MTRIARLLAVLLILGLGSRAAFALPPDQAQAWREDLRFMAVEMERLHKNLFHTLAREHFAARLAALDANLATMERHEVIVEIARLVAAVGDGHTNVYPTRDPKIGFRTLPLQLTFFGDELIVRAAPQAQRALVGARVLRIGGMATEAAYAAVREIIGRDNEQGARYWAQYLLAMPEVLHALRITASVNEVPLTLRTAAGEETVQLAPWAPVEMMSGEIVTLFRRREGWTDARDAAERPDPAWLRRSAEPFHLERLDGLLYVQINQIGDAAGETLAAFAQRLRDEIATRAPDKLVLDLRLNRGGNATLNPPLVRALVQSQAVDRPGRLFAIIGPGTFSAAQMLADALETYTRVIFVGEPSGSKGNAYGDSRRITLPRSGITVRVSIYHWQNWHPADRRDATQPQLPAPLDFDAYRRNIDPALEAIKAYAATP